MDSRLILVVIGVIAAAFGRSEAIICYSCSSNSDSKCLDPFKSDGVPNCTGAATCVKAIGTVSGVTFVARYCDAKSVDKDECIDVSISDLKGKACFCRTDYCNDGQMVQPTSYNVIIGVAMATVVSIAWMKQS